VDTRREERRATVIEMKKDKKKTKKNDAKPDAKAIISDGKHDKNTMRRDGKYDKNIRNVSGVRRKKTTKRAPRTTGNDVKRRLNLSAIEQLYASGLINRQVAEACGVSERTLHRYKHDEEVMAVVMRGKKKANERIIQSLFKRATGYEYAEVTMEPVLSIRQKDGVKEKVMMTSEQQVTKTVIKHVPADQGAIEFWLTNREPDEWKKKIDVESGGKKIEPRTYYLPHFNGVVQVPKQ
jgi:hypothetical protein